MLPHKFAPGGPSTLLLLHETGATENDLIPIGRAVARNAALLSPRLGETQSSEIANFIAQAAAQYNFDPDKLYALGYASGADLAASLLVLHPKLLAGVILLRGVLPVRPEPMPDLAGTPVLILAGQHDGIARPQDTDAMARALTSAGATVEVHWMNEGRDLGPEDFQAAAKWMKAR
jgi:predicted esterase